MSSQSLAAVKKRQNFTPLSLSFPLSFYSVSSSLSTPTFFLNFWFYLTPYCTGLSISFIVFHPHQSPTRPQPWVSAVLPRPPPSLIALHWVTWWLWQVDSRILYATICITPFVVLFAPTPYTPVRVLTLLKGEVCTLANFGLVDLQNLLPSLAREVSITRDSDRIYKMSDWEKDEVDMLETLYLQRKLRLKFALLNWETNGEVAHRHSTI